MEVENLQRQAALRYLLFKSGSDAVQKSVTMDWHSVKYWISIYDPKKANKFWQWRTNREKPKDKYLFFSRR